MKSTEICLPRPVGMHLFVQPNQRMRRLDYASIRDAKKVWHFTRLINAAQRELHPWTSCVEWHYSKDNDARQVRTVSAAIKPVLRYQNGDVVLASDIESAKPWTRRRNRTYKGEQPSQRTVGRRLRYQQSMDDTELSIRAELRVHPGYYSDAWRVRETERNWKSHRKTQWRT